MESRKCFAGKVLHDLERGGGKYVEGAERSEKGRNQEQIV